MNFFKPYGVMPAQNLLPPPQNNSFYNKNNFSVDINFVNSNLLNGKYVFTFMNSVGFNGLNNIGINAASKINNNILKEKLEGQIKDRDKKYIKLATYNTTKSVYVFDEEKWLTDGLKNVKSSTSLFNKFNREFKLKEQLPYMLLVFGASGFLEKNVADLFKKYVKTNREIRKSLQGLIPETMNKAFNADIGNMFDYVYDRQNNKIIANMKSQYVAIMIYSVGKVTKMF
jgi:hypothetical protein